MRVIHHNQGLACLLHALHAAGHGLQIGAQIGRLLQRDAALPQARQHAQHIVDVVLPDQPGLQVHAVAVLFLHGKCQAFGAVLHTGYLQSRRLGCAGLAR